MKVVFTVTFSNFNLCEVVITTREERSKLPTNMKLVIITCMGYNYHLKFGTYNLEESVKSTLVGNYNHSVVKLT